MLDKKYRILTKSDLKYYLECDKLASNIHKKKPSIIPIVDYIWKFQICLRKTEYLSNQNNKLLRILGKIYYYRYKLLCRKYNVEIPLNCIWEGLVIWHLSRIIINDKSKIGKNVSLSSGVVIGQSNGKQSVVGDNVILMLDARVLGAKITDNVAIGASSLVLSDITEQNTVHAGIPAKKISYNYPNKHSELSIKWK